VAAPGARLMTHEDSTRAEPVAVGTVLGWQDHPAAIGTRHEVAEAGHPSGWPVTECFADRSQLGEDRFRVGQLEADIGPPLLSLVYTRRQPSDRIV